MVNIPMPPENDSVPETRGIGRSLIPWLILLALAVLFVPLFVGASTIESAVAPLATESDILQATITAPPPAPLQEQTLTANLLSLRSRLAALENIPATLVAEHIDWPAIMASVLSYDTNRIRLLSFNQENTHLTLQGKGLEESAVLEYVTTLQNMSYFSGVHVQSITLDPVGPPTPDLETGVSPIELYMPFDFTLSLDLAGELDGTL